MKYLVTVLDPAREPPAIAVLYCGRHWLQVERAVAAARKRRMFKGKTVRVVASDAHTVISIHDFPIEVLTPDTTT